MTYNIHHGEGTDSTVDIDRIATLILDSGADIVALQEVDRGVERTRKIDIMTTLSDLTGMTYAFGKNIDYQGGDYGNGILTRFPILAEKNLHYQMLRPGEQRGLQQLVLDFKGTEVVFMNTHLDYRGDDSERLTNIKEIISTSQQYSQDLQILCGDFNDVPESKTIVRLGEACEDVWQSAGNGPGYTYPAKEPVKRIDYIFTLRSLQADSLKKGTVRLKATAARVLQSNASDHRAVLAEFEFQ